MMYVRATSAPGGEDRLVGAVRLHAIAPLDLVSVRGRLAREHSGVRPKPVYLVPEPAVRDLGEQRVRPVDELARLDERSRRNATGSADGGTRTLMACGRRFLRPVRLPRFATSAWASPKARCPTRQAAVAVAAGPVAAPRAVPCDGRRGRSRVRAGAAAPGADVRAARAARGAGADAGASPTPFRV
jgi:hypothetical protein